jgi:class 3 adenylate cyclase
MATLLQTLRSYVPALIVRRWAAEGSAFSCPTAQCGPAAVFFADIKGFTALTERLAARGSAGAEDLTQILNEYLGRLVDLVTAHGGDVVKFAGDAVLALWEADEAGVAVAVRQAAVCALTVQAGLNDYPVVSDVRLSMKLAIGAGEVLTETLGGCRDLR